MERKTHRIGLVNLLALVVIGSAGYAVARFGGSFAGVTGTAFAAIGVLVAAVSWFQMRLEEREKLEKMEFDELSKSAGRSALFNASETEVFPAQRSREQFERIFVPAFTVLLFVLQAGGAYFLWRDMSKALPSTMQQPLVCLGLNAMFFLLLFLLGKYTTSLARLDGLRLLRPGASCVMLLAYVSFFVAAAIAAVVMGFPLVDLYLARVFIIVLFLTGLETLVNLILELYRPRVKGKVQRPVYESRLISLLGQPEGLITTAAQTLDYQFGFKVSDTWAYRLVEQWLPWLIITQVTVLLLSTTVVFIDTGEQAILERCGKPVAGRTVLGPGAHLKWPWPIDMVYRYPTERIQKFDVGYVPDTNSAANKVVLWTISHNKEENFLIGDRLQTSASAGTNGGASVQTPPVSLLTVSVPVQYQITNLVSWVYTNEEPATLLEHIANRAVVHYLAGAELHDLLAQSRFDAGRILRDQIQAEADRQHLGANIIFVGLQDIHPPQKVAADYEKVVAAIHAREAARLSATADAIRTNALATASAYRIVSEANSEKVRREADALARAALFTNQIPPYLASPSVYKQRALMQMFERSVTNSRMYVLLATNTEDVIMLNLEDKISKDILQNLTTPDVKKK